MRSRRLLALAPLMLCAGLLLIGYQFGVSQLMAVAVVLGLTVGSLAGFLRYGRMFLLLELLAVGFFAGWLKLRFSSWVGYAIPDILCVLLVLSVFFVRPSDVPLPRHPLTYAVLLLTAYCLLEFLNPEAPLVRSLAGLRSWMLYTWLLFVGYAVAEDRRQVLRICQAVLVLAALTAALGLYQWHRGPTALYPGETSAAVRHYVAVMGWQEEGTERVFRAFSTFVSPNTFGSNMAAALVIAAVLLSGREAPVWTRRLAIVGIPLWIGGIVASGSRAPVVLCVIGVAAVLWLRRGRKALTLALVVAFGVWAGLRLTTDLISARYASLLDPQAVMAKWLVPLQAGIGIATLHPFGKGLGFTAGMPSLGSFAGGGFTEVETINVDSGFGAAAAEMGFLGMAIYLFLVIQIVLAPLRVWRALPDSATRDALAAPVSLALVFGASSLLSSIAASLPWSVFFWVLIGMSLKGPAMLYREFQERALAETEAEPGGELEAVRTQGGRERGPARLPRGPVGETP